MKKKLATYPRTDSQYLTEDMQATATSLILWLREHMPFGKGCAGEPDIDRVTDGNKVTDHHAIIPTVEIARTDLSELPFGERDVLTLIAARLLSATAQAHRFEAVAAILDCRDNSFTAKGKTVLQAEWKEVERLYRMGLKQSSPEDDGSTDASLPMLQDGRISRDNKAWAQTVPVCEDKDGFGHDRNVCFIVDRCNPGLTDRFLAQARRECAQVREQKPSVRGSLNKNTWQQAAHSDKPKMKKEQER